MPNDPTCAADSATPPAADARGRRTHLVLWLIAGLLGVIALELTVRDGGISLDRAALAQFSNRAGAQGIQAFTGQLDKNTFGLFMLDVEAGTIWCYEFAGSRPNDRRLRLVAAREWLYDRYLRDYNVDEPSPDTVAAMVEHQRMLSDTDEASSGAESSEDDTKRP